MRLRHTERNDVIKKGQVTAKKELGGSDFSKAQDYAMKKNILEANERGQNSVVRSG
ncbi:unnamed protein product [Lepidochelys olivacea]